MHTCHTKHIHPLKWAIFIAFIFMALEVVFGIIANSLALLSDALHMFADVGALGLSFIVIQIAKRPRTPTMSFGYKRAEILGALASSLSLWGLCAVLIYEAITRLITPEPVRGPVVFVIATLGLAANVLMMRLLHKEKENNINIAAAYLHVLGDLLGSIGVILSGLILWITKWYPIDPIITLLFSIIILYHSGKIIKQTVSILMESAPAHLDPAQIKKELLSLPDIIDVHDLHIWSVAQDDHALSAHLVAKNTDAALQEAHALLEKKYHLRHMTLQMETPDAFEARFCFDCDTPKGV